MVPANKSNFPDPSTPPSATFSAAKDAFKGLKRYLEYVMLDH